MVNGSKIKIEDYYNSKTNNLIGNKDIVKVDEDITLSFNTDTETIEAKNIKYVMRHKVKKKLYKIKHKDKEVIVTLTAFDSRLSSTCLRRTRSANTAHSAGSSTLRPMPAWSARGWIRWRQSSTQRRQVDAFHRQVDAARFDLAWRGDDDPGLSGARSPWR